MRLTTFCGEMADHFKTMRRLAFSPVTMECGAPTSANLSCLSSLFPNPRSIFLPSLLCPRPAAKRRYRLLGQQRFDLPPERIRHPPTRSTKFFPHLHYLRAVVNTQLPEDDYEC